MANDGRADDREDQTRAASWVLVAGGFHSNGGMDRLNLALARHLLSLGSRVNLVCHHAETALRADGAVVHIVPRPAQSFMLGEMLLARRARKIARQVIAGFPGTRVLVNGGNCNWPDINWVHCVHHTWQSRDGKSSPLWFRVKRRYARMRARRQERAALSQAAIVIANSARTRHDLIAHLQIQPDRIHVAYPGSDSNFVPAPPQTRTEARAWLHKEQGRPLIAFIGAMGFDCNKGFDTLFET